MRSTVAISAIRFKFLGQIDSTWDSVESTGWFIGELASALTCACLPILRPFFAKFFPSLTGSSSRPAIGYNNEKSGNGGESRRGWWPFRSRNAEQTKGVGTSTEIREVRHELGNDGQKYEVYGDGQGHEAPGDGMRHEAPGDGMRHEAPGDGPGAAWQRQ